VVSGCNTTSICHTNYSFADVTRLPYPDWGVVPIYYGDGWSNYHGVETAIRKRFSRRWQAAATYTLSGFWDAEGAPDVGFTVAPDLGGEYSLAATDQRHRAVFNGIWQLGRGFQLSGAYHYGSGLRYGTSYGADLRAVGIGGTNRLRPDGGIVARNNFVGDATHRADIRIQRRFRLRGNAAIEGIAEVFNLFDHANYGTYTTTEVSAAYGRPSPSTAVVHQPRMVQLAFRLVF
jgi:hypothetical protein